jgi:hypothetical protein
MATNFLLSRETVKLLACRLALSFNCRLLGSVTKKTVVEVPTPGHNGNHKTKRPSHACDWIAPGPERPGKKLRYQSVNSEHQTIFKHRQIRRSERRCKKLLLPSLIGLLMIYKQKL